MGKGMFVFIGILVIIGLFYYYKPAETKETFKKGVDYSGSIVKDYLNSQPINLGRPTIPCTIDTDCNTIERCEDNCSCIGGDCIKG